MLIDRFYDSLTLVGRLLAPLAMRTGLAVPFFRSGLTKWDGLGVLSPSAEYLFSDEFRLHLFGATVPFPAPQVFAYVDGVLEIALPILLVVGLGTRFSALALLIMTGVIELVVPDAWETYHLPWAAMALGLLALGAGPLSLDDLLRRHFSRDDTAEDR